jgi:hypothetical protein
MIQEGKTMKQRRNPFRHFLVPFLSVFLLFNGLSIPAYAEETDPLNTEPVSETVTENTVQEDNTPETQDETPNAVSEEQKQEEETTVTEGNGTETSGNEVTDPEVTNPEVTDPETEQEPKEEAVNETEKESETEEKIQNFLKGTLRGEENQEELQGETKEEEEKPKIKRTVLLYLCGTDLESGHTESATHNLNQILGSEFSATGEIRFVVLTGGTIEWHVDSQKTVTSDGTSIKDGINEEEDQVWECFGADAPDEKFQSKMMLLDDQTGIPKDGLMSDYKTLTAFINYVYKHYPSEKYDLILWDHGGGVQSGFAVDENKPERQYRIFLKDMLTALKENDLTKNHGKFETINYDACLMGTLEYLLALSPYMNYYIASPRSIPGDGQEYSCWLNMLGEKPDISTMELGKAIVDRYVEYYEYVFSEATLTVTDVNAVLKSGIVEAFDQIEDVLYKEATTPSAQSTIEFYDELNSSINSLMYTYECYRDLGHFIGQLGIAMEEAHAGKDTPSEQIDDTNLYTEVVKPLQRLLYNQNLFYGGATNKYTSGNIFVRDYENNEISYDKYPPSAVYVYFPNTIAYMTDVKVYLERMTAAMAYMEGDKQYESILPVLKKHVNNVARYALFLGTGYTVSQMYDYEGMTEIHMNDVFDWWKKYPNGNTYNVWNESYGTFVGAIG